MRKLRVGIVFGGRSGEHEVSLASASSVLAALDRDRYEPVPIGITREGQWLIADSPEQLLAGEVTLQLPDTDEAMPDVSHHGIVRVHQQNGLIPHETAVDVVIPLIHGPYGEDGRLQGLLEMADLPYVGSEVTASALCMDKVFMKIVLAEAGLPSVDYALITRPSWRRGAEATMDRLEEKLAYPVFVKPCNLGSSVGISRAADRDELRAAIELAARYDERIIVEEAVDAREVECSVLGNDDPVVSVIGEIVPHRDFYDYEAKYTDGLTDLIIPANLSAEQAAEVRDYAIAAFQAVNAAGLARVDFFIRRSDGKVLINEINTMPGFTPTSMYPRLWAASGLPYPALIDRLIELALGRHQQKQDRLTTR